MSLFARLRGSLDVQCGVDAGLEPYIKELDVKNTEDVLTQICHLC